MMQQTAVKLIAWHVNGSIRSYELEADQGVFVGTSSNCGLQLSGHDISDIHCRIGFEDGQLWVQDWTSSKGTKLNGTPVASKTKVGQGSVVEVGPYKIQISKADVAMEEGTPLEAEQKSEAQLAGSSTSELSAAESASGGLERPSPGAAPEARGEPGAGEQRRTGDADPVAGTRQQNGLPEERDQQSDSDSEGLANSAMGFDADFFSEDEVYDRETVELLQAEIEDLRTALAQRDADHVQASEAPDTPSAPAEESEKMLHRMQELVDEANRADERVLLLEEMLHAAEDANRSEVEERGHLEAWVGDIEKRIGQREQEHAAELDALRERLDTSDEQCHRLQHQLQQAATTDDSAHHQYEETMENLQQNNSQLQDLLAAAQKELRQLQQKCENQSEQNEVALREERAKIAKEHAEMSRLKFEYAQKIKDLEEMPKAEADPRLQSLREHRQYLREMSEQKKLEKLERQDASLSNRLKRLWNRVES